MTILEIFRSARLSSLTSVNNHTLYFVDLEIDGVAHHGQLNIARATDYGGPWYVTIYILVTAPHRGVATSFQHRATILEKAIAEVERLTTEWATAQEQPTP
jgi:hypothetical protein